METTIMKAPDAYPGSTYESRLATVYRKGDRVTIGPRYISVHEYETDPFCGRGIILEVLEAPRTHNTYLVCNTQTGVEAYLYASRLTPR